MSTAQSTLSPFPAPETPAALVTGGSRGIGRAIARTLARDGFQVFLTYASRPAEAEKTVAEIAAAGGRARAFALNVGDSAAVADFFAEEIKGKANLAVLVNNAGITKDGFLVRMKDEDFDRVLAVNLRGAFVCSREAAKIMSRNRSGRIINIASVVGQMGNAGQANYVAAKAGLIGLTKSCAKELAARSITVNAVAPGFIETDMTAALPDETRASYVESIPLKRMGLPQDVAEAVAFLASDKAAYITGQVLAVNGGMYC
ncbi:3-oxoacyl-[acyl-carrier-protein] reductase [Desulfovibrio sp. ZJ200]|uniref:3-oxoacyl-[acyl-carrier-protein] reductase n=1 Tax=Desulfovibrio sp. ZJ200 TaxID=2709792 RepID=UPI0013EC2BCE|nr:3-oxoacyl-[acyl-carrier-protein] reductase [Desulfovibrio sp. ZJ200]